jgi:hypothetical protein
MGIKSKLNDVGLCLVIPIVIVISLVRSFSISIKPNQFNNEEYIEKKI